MPAKKTSKTKTNFLDHIHKGRRFEAWERSQWKGGINDSAKPEAVIKLKNDKTGRMDLRLELTEDGSVVIVEIKATDWDKIKPDRIRSTALRHAAQVWRYILAYLEPEGKTKPPTVDVIPSIVYPHPPKDTDRKSQVEAILEEKGIQVVWREEYKNL